MAGSTYKYLYYIKQGDEMKWTDREPDPSTEWVVEMVCEQVFSFREYNVNRYFRKSPEGKPVGVNNPMAELSALERGHVYTGKPLKDTILVQSLRIADEETRDLVKGLDAFVFLPKYGKKTDVQAFGHSFNLTPDEWLEFQKRVEVLGGKVIDLTVDMDDLNTAMEVVKEAASRAQKLRDEVVHKGKLVTPHNSEQTLNEIELLVKEFEKCITQSDEAASIAQLLSRRLQNEPERLADKARAEALSTVCEEATTNIKTWLEDIHNVAVETNKRAVGYINATIPAFDTSETIAERLERLVLAATRNLKAGKRLNSLREAIRETADEGVERQKQLIEEWTSIAAELDKFKKLLPLAEVLLSQE